MREKIFEALDRHFKTESLIFWYDDEGKQEEFYTAYKNPAVEKIKLANDEFNVKYRVLRKEPLKKYLVYSPKRKPGDSENWLLDLNLQHLVFASNAVSWLMKDLDIDEALEEIVRRHQTFFENRRDRVDPLKTHLARAGARIIEENLELFMLVILAGSGKAEKEKEASIKDAARNLIKENFTTQEPQNWAAVEKYGLTPFFWKQMEKAVQYTSTEPTLENLTAHIFAEALNLETGESTDPAARNCYTFLDSWRNTYDAMESFKQVSERFEGILRIRNRLEVLSIEDLSAMDLFKETDRQIVHKLMDAAKKGGMSAKDAVVFIEKRRAAFWVKTDDSGKILAYYDTLLAAFRLELMLAELKVLPSALADLWTLYTDKLYQADTLYRRFLECYETLEKREQFSDLLVRVEKLYIGNFLIPLAFTWQDALDKEKALPESLKQQRSFFRDVVKPYIDQDKIIFVVCSDALRYEAGRELVGELEMENRIQVETDVMLSSVPSITSLGLACLLPHETVSLDKTKPQVMVDKKRVGDLGTREKALISYFTSAYPGKSVKALDAVSFSDLPLAQQEEEIKGMDCVYLYSRYIDATGDNAKTETILPRAVRKEIDFLKGLIKKIIGLNRTHVVITADHGFLYQYTEVAESDFLELIANDREIKRDKRYVLGNNLPHDNRFMLFQAKDTGLDDGPEILIPKGISRIRKQGGGSRYVHGGMSLQELCIPVIKVRKTREDDVRHVTFAAFKGTDAITTNQVSVKFIQEEPVSAKVKPITVAARFEGADGTILSNQRRLVFESEDPAEQNRTQTAGFTFGKEADKFNNTVISLVFYEERYGQRVKLSYAVTYRLKKSLSPDF